MTADPRRDHELSRRSFLKGAGLGVATAFALAACGEQGGPSARSAAISVTDQRGKTVTFARPARRVVTIPMPAASMLIAVDEGVQHLVGMHQASWAAIRDGNLGEIFPQAEKIPHGVAGPGFAPNVESIVALNPDLVVQWGDEGAGIIAPLENAGLTVLGLEYGTQQDLETWLTLFATVLGKKDRATAMLSRINASLDHMTAIGATAPTPKPSILYFNRFASELKVAAHNTYNDFSITLVGATNPAAGDQGLMGMAGVDVEQVLAWDPDIVLLGNFDDAMPDDVYDAKVWQDTTAVKTRRVYKVPLGGYRWDPPSHESPLMWRWLSMIAFPGRDRFDLRGEITSYYRFLYNYQPTDAQIDTILWFDVNGRSANYGQFDAA